jgi:hypothetical protein
MAGYWFFLQMTVSVGFVFAMFFTVVGVSLVLLASTATLDQGFWIDTSSWALPVGMTWDFGRWVDGAPYWQLTIQVLCFYWRAGTV